MIYLSNPRPLWGKVPAESSTEAISTNEHLFLSSDESDFSFVVKRSDWDSHHIGKDVYHISSFTSTSTMNPSLSFATFGEWESSLAKPSIVWARLASEAGGAVRALETAGFRHISVLNSYIWSSKSVISSSTNLKMRNSIPEDAVQIGNIGANAFLFDRLHFDPAIQKNIAENMYRDWSANCVKGLCDTVLIAEIDNEIAGFISLNPDKLFSSSLCAKFQRIALVAVSSIYRGKGVGVQLVSAAKQRTFDEGFDYLLVGTSSVNLPAQNLYSKCDFKPYYTEIFLGKIV